MAAAAADAAPALEGVDQVAYLLYAVPGAPLWHQRWNLGRVVSCPSDAILVSPDHQVQCEVVDGTSPDISAVRWARALAPRPPGVVRAYRFASAPTAAEVAAWLPEAQAEARRCFARRHPGVAVPAPVFEAWPWAAPGAPAAAAGPAPPAGAPAAGPPGGGWVVVPAGGPPAAAAPVAPAPAPLPGGVMRRGGAAAGAAPAAGGGEAGGAPAPAGAALAAAVVGGARPLVLAGGAGDAAPAPVGNWRVAQEWRGYHYGDVIIPPAGFAGAGTPARGVVLLADGSSLFVEWVAIGDESDFADRAVAPDCRLLPVRLDRAGRPFRTLENLVESCRQEHLPDFIAPRTTMWCLEHLAGEGRSLESHFEHFKKLCGLQDSQWGMEEYASVISYLKALLQHDQVDASNILSVEMMFRRLQTIEYCYSDKLRERTAGSSAGRLTADEQAAFGATARAESRLMVSPALLESAKQELERDASLAKSLLKAREARESLGKRRQGQGKDQGSGGGDPDMTGDARHAVAPPGNFDRNVGRDLLPFPTELLNSSEPPAPGLSRVCRQRVGRRQRRHADVLRCLEGLNTIYGRREGVPVPADLSLGQQRMLDHVESSVSFLGPPPEDLSQAAALQALRLGLPYDAGGGPVGYEASRRLVEAGVAELTLERPTEVVDCFFVKKGGGKQRLVVDCRRSNQHFEPPAPVSLVSGDTLSQVHGDDSLDQPVFIGQVDIKDAFYHMELPEGLRQYFGLRRIRASWAGISQAVVRERLAGVSRALVSRGLPLHKESVSCDRAIVLGWEIDCLRRTFRPTPERVWKARLAIRGLLARASVSGGDLERLLGHLCFIGLCRRESLSVFKYCYRFCEAARRGPARGPRALWASARKELDVWDRIAPLIWVNTSAGTCPDVVVVDASPWGLGAVRGRPPVALVKEACRHSERAGAREAAREGRPPRERAFAAAAAQLHGGEGEADRRILMELVRPQSRHHRPESEFDRRHTKSFEDVPLDLLRAPWRVCGRQRWKRASTSMPALEAEALLYGVRHLLRSVANLGSRLLVIGDSISASLAATKGRSSCDGMLSVTRRLGALLLGTGSLLRSRWIASELNPADGPSRGRPAPSDPLAGLRRELATAAGEGRNAGARQVRQIEDPRGPPAAAAQCGAQMSLLRRASVSAKTQAQYSLYLAALQRFCDSRGDHPNTEEEWDIATAGLMEIMFMEGGSLSAGEKLLASVQWAEPRLGRLGGGRMPVCRQCLRGWRRAAPAGGRWPLPYDVVALLACWMICQGLRPHALAILMMMEMYLRPGEPFLLRGRDVVAGSLSGAREWTPTSVLLHPFEMRTSSKSQEFDQTIVLDLDRQAALADALVQLGLERGVGPLLDLTPSALRRALDEAAAAWRLGPLGPLDAYRFRHAGASVDFATGARRLEEIQRRGRWRSARSLRRYEHGGRLADLLRRLPPDVQRAAAAAAQELPDALRGSFAGSGHLSDAMERGNVPTLRWDILYGPAYDLRDPRSARLIRGWIRAGLVCGLHAGFPCETFSRARDRPNGPPRLRSQEHVWGLPSLHPEGADFQKVKWGNLYARLTISFCVLCCQCFVPWSVENPALSYAWQLPPMLSLLQRRQVTTQVIEYCRFGTPWRKSTRIAAFLLDLAPLAKFRCTGPVCVLTGQRHQELSGKDASGRFRTRLAEAYPRKLCSTLARAYADEKARRSVEPTRGGELRLDAGCRRGIGLKFQNPCGKGGGMPLQRRRRGAGPLLRGAAEQPLVAVETELPAASSAATCGYSAERLQVPRHRQQLEAQPRGGALPPAPDGELLRRWRPPSCGGPPSEATESEASSEFGDRDREEEEEEDSRGRHPDAPGTQKRAAPGLDPIASLNKANCVASLYFMGSQTRGAVVMSDCLQAHF
ncbi:unnamed protein product [Prorocentrum cordatum]|uniref:Uncharacterized protein n=1 Tax=Prorocentrum cordatum TaxID=2364126 RepID=A0ABN9TVY0_9DINO|nr:unnamed protein product [Polarella glacialis]